MRDGVVLLASLEFEHRSAARDRRGYERAEIFRARPFVEQTVPDKGDQVPELAGTQMNRQSKPPIEPRQDGFDGSQSMGKVTIDAGREGIVIAGRLFGIQMVMDSVFELRERSVVEERGRYAEVSQRRGPEFITI